MILWNDDPPKGDTPGPAGGEASTCKPAPDQAAQKYPKDDTRRLDEQILAGRQAAGAASDRPGQGGPRADSAEAERRRKILEHLARQRAARLGEPPSYGAGVLTGCLISILAAVITAIVVALIHSPW